MTVTIHFAGRDPGDLVRELTALALAAGERVRTSSAGVVVPDDIARRWLTAHTPNGAAPAAADEPEIQTWQPDPPARRGPGRPRKPRPTTDPPPPPGGPDG
jgi:hypothetical protein